MKPTTKTPRSRSRVVAVRGSKTVAWSGLPQARPVTGGDFWRWGNDNRMPETLAEMSRCSTTHRRIINDKADYISGKGFTHEPTADGADLLDALIGCANGRGETLRQVVNRLAFDKSLFGNAFLEIVTDAERSFLSLHHRDASQCRLGRDNRSVILHHDWPRYTPAEAHRLPIFPAFETGADGLARSIVHFKDYEPTFVNYGVPSYIAGMNVSMIAWKTDRWNIQRLDNSFQLSGVMMLDGGVSDENTVGNILDTAERKFAGKPGQVMFLVKNGGGGAESSQFIPISSANDGDWRSLHDQATSDIVVAHSWFRSLSGLDYGGGFSSERILWEYQIALSTVIVPEQTELLEPIRRAIEHVLGVDASSLEVVNRPPTDGKPLYMKVWEARRADGLDYDPDDPQQRKYVSEITKYNLRSVD
jgi:hypothetical protein